MIGVGMPVHAGDRPATLLVPGWRDRARDLRYWRARLIGWGWAEQEIEAVSFVEPHGSNREHAAELASAVESLAKRTGRERVAVVAHSMGGLALREYLTGRLHRVHTAIFVGTPHRGTWAALVAWGRGGSEMRPGSRFLHELNARPLPANVRAHCVSTPLDTRVLPNSSTFLPGVPRHRVWLPTHPGLLRHERTIRLIRDLLLQG